METSPKKQSPQPKILPNVEMRTIPHENHPPHYNEVREGKKNKPMKWISKGLWVLLFTILASHQLIWRLYFHLITLCHKLSSCKGNHLWSMDTLLMAKYRCRTHIGFRYSTDTSRYVSEKNHIYDFFFF